MKVEEKNRKYPSHFLNNTCTKFYKKGKYSKNKKGFWTLKI